MHPGTPPPEDAKGPAPGHLSALIANARDGDREALGRALEAIRQYVRFIASKRLDPALNAKVGISDVVQDSFAQAHDDFPAFRGQTSAEFRGWIRQIVVHVAGKANRAYRPGGKRDERREIKVDPLDSRTDRVYPALISDSTTPEGRAIRHEALAILRAAINELPDRDRDVICWRYLDDLSFKEIGDRLGISEDGAYKAWHRALPVLKGKLARKGLSGSACA